MPRNRKDSKDVGTDYRLDECSRCGCPSAILIRGRFESVCPGCKYGTDRGKLGPTPGESLADRLEKIIEIPKKNNF